MSVDPLVSVKVMLTAIFAAISLRFSAIGNLLWLFTAAVVLDYITGIAAAIYNKQLNSGLGLRGVIKKVAEFCIIAVAMMSDEVVSLAANYLNVTVSTYGAISAIVTIWLILNELISILENIAKINVALPPFLMSAIKLLKQHTEAKQKVSQDEINPDNPK